MDDLDTWLRANGLRAKHLAALTGYSEQRLSAIRRGRAAVPVWMAGWCRLWAAAPPELRAEMLADAAAASKHGEAVIG